MFSFQLSAEQQEFRDTVRDFIAREVKPFANHPDRLQAEDMHFDAAILEQASQMGLRTLALSEALGGAGADTLTACVVTEELAAGDIGFATTLARTSDLGHVLFDQAMSEAQRKQFLKSYLEDDNYHLAYAGCDRECDDGGWIGTTHSPHPRSRAGGSERGPLSGSGIGGERTRRPVLHQRRTRAFRRHHRIGGYAKPVGIHESRTGGC